MTDLSQKVQYDNDVVRAALYKLLKGKGIAIQDTQVPDGWMPTDPELEACMMQEQINKSWGFVTVELDMR
jgi:hypothetical protein